MIRKIAFGGWCLMMLAPLLVTVEKVFHFEVPNLICLSLAVGGAIILFIAILLAARKEFKTWKGE